MHWLVTLLMLIVQLATVVEPGTVIFNNWVSTSTRNENDDAQYDITTSFTARCYYTWTYNCDGDGNNCNTGNHDKLCTCSIPSSRMFGLSGDRNGYILYKKECTDTDCGGSYPGAAACSSTDGCATAGSSESVTVTCLGSHSANGQSDSASDSATHTMSFTAESPILDITNLDSSVNADRTQNSGDTIFTPSANLPILEYEESNSVSPSLLLNTDRLFRLNTGIEYIEGTGNVYIHFDPSEEYTSQYTMDICVYSRRQSNCGTLTINFSGCFQRPTCDDASGTFADTFAVGGTLFTVNAPAPTAPFDSISSTWQGLSFTIDSTDLSVATVDLSTGIVTTTGNLTVFPSYPDKSYFITIRVANSASCSYNSTCTLSITATFTNWDIRFENLDHTRPIHEDTDARTHLHTIVTFDYNHPDEDNVTCEITSNPATDLFEMVYNGNPNSSYEYNSAQIYKKACTDPGCGPMCDSGIGCLSYDNTTGRSYEIIVECADGYGSTATGTLTVNIEENKAPVWTNIPNTITLNTDDVADTDVRYSFYYTDAESESLYYNYTVTPSTSLFFFDPFGNYYDNTANVTALLHQWELGNETFDVYVCGTERRNTVCGDLTIQIRDYCGPTPNCTDDINNVTDQTAVGTTLFNINVPPPSTGSFTSLSYSIASRDISLFAVNAATGNVQTAANLPIKNPPDVTRYSITAYVYDTAACKIGVCHLAVNVNFTNMDISIDNVDGVVENLHEDTKVTNTLLTVITSDANSDDRVSCDIDEANSVPADNGKFLIQETFTGSEVFMIVNREEPGFDYDNTTSYDIVVTCNDLYGSTATATMTVSIDENQLPVLSNLPAGTSVNVDLMTEFAGDSVFTLTATDVENDALTYYCNITSSLVPLECNSGGVVLLTRNITLSENGTTYQTTMCVIEPVHSHTVCETLSILITSSKTEPEISNLPYSASFDETTSIGTSLFTVSVTDPDVGETHTFTLEYIQPLNSEAMFTFHPSSGLLSLASSFDFETQTTYNLTFSVQDNYLSSAAYKTLYLVVNDINEAPNLTLFTTQLSTTEGNAGQFIGWMVYSCFDIDTGQTTTVTLSGGTHLTYFNMDSVSGNLTLAQDWDFESGVTPVLPELTSLDVTCSDGAGLTDTKSVNISFTPVNEFQPVLSITEIELVIYSNQSLQDWLFNVTATDADYNDDGQFVFDIVGNGTGAQYFYISNTGYFYLSNYIDWYYNYTFRFTVEVTDSEPVPLSASVNVTIHYIAPEPETATRPTKCVTCTGEGIAVMATIGVGSFLIVCFIIHACIRTKCWTLCQSEPIRMHKQQLRRVRRRKMKQEFVEMIQNAFQPDIKEKDEEEYEPNYSELQKARPTSQPPARFLYLGQQNYNKIPAPVYYNPEVQLETVPEPKIIPENEVMIEPPRHSTEPETFTSDLDHPPVSPTATELYGEPSVPKTYNGEPLVPGRLFGDSTVRSSGNLDEASQSFNPSQFLGRKSATKRKWDMGF